MDVLAPLSIGKLRVTIYLAGIAIKKSKWVSKESCCVNLLLATGQFFSGKMEKHFSSARLPNLLSLYLMCDGKMQVFVNIYSWTFRSSTQHVVDMILYLWI